ncbi:MAG: ACT domain-containing protein [Oscillospiraceae bacterium]|jgi:ACT domain-containing protein|nr:ACT domain-containing protein [Oscillospiraceae bacterium]
MRAIVTVLGRDTVGIIAEVSSVLRDSGVNILDISQSVLQDMFAMVMLTDISGSRLDFPELSALLETAGVKMGVKVIVMHEDIFNAMHRI